MKFGFKFGLEFGSWIRGCRYFTTVNGYYTYVTLTIDHIICLRTGKKGLVLGCGSNVVDNIYKVRG